MRWIPLLTGLLALALAPGCIFLNTSRFSSQNPAMDAEVTESVDLYSVDAGELPERSFETLGSVRTGPGCWLDEHFVSFVLERYPHADAVIDADVEGSTVILPFEPVGMRCQGTVVRFTD